MERITIFDTTLRDGEQSPGASMNTHEKLQVALALQELKVDVIEAGFPVASPDDFNAVTTIAKNIDVCEICALARCNDNDIKQAAKALAQAGSPRIHTFIATSDIHMQKKLKLSPEQVIEKAVRGVKLAKNYTDNVEFSAEDACRSSFDFLCRILDAVITAGATTINIPDTVGFTTPFEYGKLINDLRQNIANIDKAKISTHCHDDLGLAVANSLCGVLNGARQIECTIAGIGERAGNAALEEIVMAIKTREDIFQLKTRVNNKKLVPTAHLLSSITSFAIAPNKAIIGENAFAHESGIHQDGIIKSRDTYEIMDATDVGWGSNLLILGKHSGKNAFLQRVTQLGFICNDEELLQQAFMKFKLMADSNKDISEDELKQLLIAMFGETK